MFRGVSYKVISYPLGQIYGTDNCRRPCPILWNLGLDPWTAYRQILSDDTTEVRKGVEMLEQSPRIRDMALTVQKDGQLQAIALRSYRSQVGKTSDGATKYEDRAALSFGNGRLFACALLDGRRKLAGEDVQKSAVTVDAILMKLTREESYELSVVENDQRTEMDDLDWGLDFDRLLKMANPITDKPYTIKEVAEKRSKNYHWVRGRAALPYLPSDMLKEITNWNKVNIDALCQLALKYKAGAKLEKAVDQGECDDEAPMPAMPGTKPVLVSGMPVEDGDLKPVSSEGEGDPDAVPVKKKSRLPLAVQPKKRRTPLTLAELQNKFDSATDPVRREVYAECMRLTPEEAEAESSERIEKKNK